MCEQGTRHWISCKTCLFNEGTLPELWRVQRQWYTDLAGGHHIYWNSQVFKRSEYLKGVPTYKQSNTVNPPQKYNIHKHANHVLIGECISKPLLETRLAQAYVCFVCPTLWHPFSKLCLSSLPANATHEEQVWKAKQKGTQLKRNPTHGKIW
jgi:hypothetical protein